MKKNSLQSNKVQYRLKAELKTTNQKPLSPLRMSSLVVVHCMYKNWIVPIIRKFGGSDLGSGRPGFGFGLPRLAPDLAF